jgi:hypothetical protein
MLMKRVHTLLAAPLTLLLYVALAPTLAPAQINAAPNYSPPPGALNPVVTQANIGQTICLRGWTKTVRLARTRTGSSGSRCRHAIYRADPATTRRTTSSHWSWAARRAIRTNLWPQPWGQARRKDKWELAPNRAVCSSRMSLADARRKIADVALWW